MSRKIFLFTVMIFVGIMGAGCDPDLVDTPRGIQYSFYLDESGWYSTTASLRKITRDVQTKFGKKTLKIWVSNDAFGSGCFKQTCITQEMVDALSQAFLQPGEDNDIYDWDTAIYGEEWGDRAHAKFPNVIDTTDTIDILLTDIDDDDSPDAGTIGYFYSKDNYVQSFIPGSNERIMFYIDSVMFANDDGGTAGWSIDDFYPQEALSTLAHEFQHMIHFYQKTILLVDGNSSKTWLDEMLAETTEDLVATRIGIPGPRHVDSDDGSAGSAGNKHGRYPIFNQSGIHLSLTKWRSTTPDYSKVSSFGTFLIRNYGGAKLLHDIMHNSDTDYRAVLKAVRQSPSGTDKTFDVLLREWGTAVLLSDKTDLPDHLPRYNTGDFIPTYFNGINYEMGSINYFNYTPEPDIQLTHNGMAIPPQSNFYYLVGNNMTGTHSLTVSLASGTEATLVMKNPTGNGVITGSDTRISAVSSGSDLNITVTAGTKTYAGYLGTGKRINLDLNLSTLYKNVYLLLTNSKADTFDTQTTISNRFEKSNRSSISPKQKRYQIPSNFPKGILREVHRFNHAAGSFLRAAFPIAKKTP